MDKLLQLRNLSFIWGLSTGNLKQVMATNSEILRLHLQFETIQKKAGDILLKDDLYTRHPRSY